MPSLTRPDFSFDYLVEDTMDALRKRGLRRPQHSTRIDTNILDDKEVHRIMFSPARTKHEFTGLMGIFDSDGVFVNELWQARIAVQFQAFLRYCKSDHRLLWAQIRM